MNNETHTRMKRIERGTLRLLSRVQKLAKIAENIADCPECSGKQVVYRYCCTGLEDGVAVCGCGGESIPEPCLCVDLEALATRYEEHLELMGFPTYGG